MKVFDVIELVGQPSTGREMTIEISRDAYRAIEDIVGADNISDDPLLSILMPSR